MSGFHVNASKREICTSYVKEYQSVAYVFQFKMYRNIILLVVLYVCETWLLTLNDERRLRVFENRVLRGIFGLERDEVTGELRKLHNEELNDLYCSPNIVRVIKSGRRNGRGM